MVLIPSDSPTAERMRTEPGWGLAYEDAEALVLVKGYAGPIATGQPAPLAFVPQPTQR
jgi:hypothetical protein